MRNYYYILLLLILVACSNPTDTEDNKKYRCIRVIDGDTYDFLSGIDTFRVRHLYIDCYETSPGSRLDGQAKKAGISSDSALKLGFEAKKLIAELIENKYCELIKSHDEDDKDIYGRFLRIVKYNGQQLDSLLLIKKLALPY